MLNDAEKPMQFFTANEITHRPSIHSMIASQPQKHTTNIHSLRCDSIRLTQYPVVTTNWICLLLFYVVLLYFSVMVPRCTYHIIHQNRSLKVACLDKSATVYWHYECLFVFRLPCKIRYIRSKVLNQIPYRIRYIHYITQSSRTYTTYNLQVTYKPMNFW